MAVKNQYQNLLRSKVISAIAQADAAAGFTHQGVKGTVLELLIGQLFEPLLPADIGVGTGQIIDSYSGELSGQIDIILYNKSILPPLLVAEKTGIFPIESVLYTIEVKTTLNASELKLAHESARKIGTKFGYRSGYLDEHGKAKPHSIKKVKSVIFALKSDLSGTGISEAERYKNLYGDEIAYIRAICVSGKEYWYDNGNYWVGFKEGEQYDEILAFIGGVTNTYRSVSESRGQPLLGNYIIPEAKGCIATKSRNVSSVQVKCQDCELEGEMIPEVGQMNLIVNGVLLAKDKCPNCEGTMKSKLGTYKFEKGVLIEGSVG